MKQKKRIHKIKDIPEKEYIIIGISTSANDYKLSWAINDKLKINLQQKKAYETIKKDLNKEYIYFISEHDNITYSLLCNKSINGSLIAELKNIDYFLKISSDNSENISKDIISKIKKIKNISGVFEINNNKLKKKDRTFFSYL